MFNIFEYLLDIFDTNEDRRLKRLQKKKEREMKEKALKTELEIKQAGINAKLEIEQTKKDRLIKLEQLESEQEQTEIKQKIFKLKNLISKDDLTIKSGEKLKKWAVLVTGISTVLTIAGNFVDFSVSLLSIAAYVLGVIALQFTVFIITSQETRIKTDFSRHYKKVITLKYMLLIISIYSNYKFFSIVANTFISKVFTLILCISLDLIAVYLVSLAYDQMTLTFSTSENRVKNESRFYKLGTVVMFKLFNKIEQEYYRIQNIKYELQGNNSNTNNIIDMGKYDRIDNYTKQPKQIVENTHDKKENDIPNIEKLTKYIDYIVDNRKENNYVEGYKKVAIKLGIGRNEVEKIKDYLIDNNITQKAKGNNTKLLINSKDEIYNKLQLQRS